jgi:DNA-binding NarL/FixJ family response regulator
MAKASSRIKILIADDHAIFRDALRKLLELDDEIKIIGEASSGSECIKKLGKLKPDILLLDLRMPDMNGLAVLEEINFDTISTHVIVLTAAEDYRDVLRAMRLGVRGVVLKESAIDLLIGSIHRVHTGEISIDAQISAEMVKTFFGSFTPGASWGKPLLTDREMEVVQLIAQGFQNKQIGKRLFISEQTVKNHLLNIFDKVGVSDRVELTLYAIHHHLIEKPDGL